MSDSATADLAKDFFSLANVIAGFHVAQSLVFLNSLTKEPELRDFVCRDPTTARKITFGICGIYLAAAIVCSAAELVLRAFDGQSCAVLCTSVFAAIGRLVLIAAISQGCTVIFRYIKPPPLPEIPVTNH